MNDDPIDDYADRVIDEVDDREEWAEIIPDLHMDGLYLGTPPY